MMLILIAIVPHTLDPIIGSLKFYRRLDFFVVFGFFTLLGLGFYNYSTLKKMEKKLETFVRKQATNQAEEHKKEQ